MTDTGPYKKLVRYKVKADRAQENIDYIKSVFRALEKAAPEGFRYTSFQLEDGVSFMHLVSVETEDGENPLLAFEEFKAFTAEISERCEEPPSISSLTTLGAYKMFN